MKHIKTLAVMVLFIALSLQVYGFGTVSHGYTHLAGGNNSGGNDVASGEPLPCGISCNNTMWFIYNPTVNGTLTVDTFGSNFDTVMAIYTGPGDSYATLVQVGCNDDISGMNNQSVVTLTAQAGTNYFIQVGGKGSASGTIALHIELIPTLVIGSTGQITSAQSAMTVTNVAEPKPCNIACKYTRWVRFDVTAAGTLTVDTMGSSFDTVLGLYSGGNGLDFATATPITCNDNAPSSTKSRVSTSVSAGTYIWAQVGGKGTVRGTIKLNYHLKP